MIPDTTSEMRLYRSGLLFSIRIPGRGELMNSRVHGSEKALAELACKRLGSNPAPRLLVGGLGMGFTLAAALDALEPGAEVVVAELAGAGGVLAVWSASPDRPFSRRLQQAGLAVEEVVVRPHRARKGSRHHIWLAAPADG